MNARNELIKAALTGFAAGTKMVEPDRHEMERMAQLSIMLADVVIEELKKDESD